MAHQGRAVGRADPEGDQRLRRAGLATAQLAGTLRRAEGRRLDRVRRLDLHRHLRRRRPQPTANRRQPATTGWRWAGASPGRPTAASCTTAPRPTRAGNPWPKEARLARGTRRPPVTAATSTGTGRGRKGSGWVGLDVPDFPPTKPPDAPAKPNGVGLDFHDGASPFIMKADGKGWLFAPIGLVDGPLPTHYEPYESPVQNAVYKQQTNPVAKSGTCRATLRAAVGSAEYPHVSRPTG